MRLEHRRSSRGSNCGLLGGYLFWKDAVASFQVQSHQSFLLRVECSEKKRYKNLYINFDKMIRSLVAETKKS